MNRFACILLLSILTIAGPAARAGDIIFEARVTLDDLDSGAHAFGIHADCHVGLDTWDLAEPPHPPENYLSVAFAMPSDDAPLPNRWRHEYRSLDDLDDGVEVWELLIESDRAGETATLTIDLAEGPDWGLEVTVVSPSGPWRTGFPVEVALPISEGRLVYWVEVRADGSVFKSNTSMGYLKVLFDTTGAR